MLTSVTKNRFHIYLLYLRYSKMQFCDTTSYKGEEFIMYLAGTATAYQSN